MASTTIAVAQDSACYDLGRANWDPPWVPDLAAPPATIPLGPEQVVDIVILGDGYQDRALFEADLARWLADFYAVEVYDRFRGAFRIRAIFTRSVHPAGADRDSHYHVKLSSSGDVSNDGWWRGGSALDREFRERLFCALELFSLNRSRYPAGLDVGGSKTVIHNTLGRMYSHLVVCLLVRGPGGPVGGRTRDVPAPDGARLNVAFAELSIHEFGHAFAYLEDEYISQRGSSASRRNPNRRSLFTLSNLSFSKRLADELWLHLSPWGTLPRQAAGSEPSPLVGWLWRGGEQDLKVWHSEYQCLMNGRHENYAYTSDAAADPTANPGGGFTGANLRIRNRYCFWCQEIVVARILEKTGQLAASGDPSDINTRGRHWYERWVTTWRPRYWSFFDLPGRITDRETYYATAANFMSLGGLMLWGSDLYQPFAGTPPPAGPPTGAALDAEWVLLLGS